MAASVSSLASHASHLFDAGNSAEAIAAYQSLLALDPSRPNAWFNLAMLFRRVRRFDDALAAYERALDFDVDGPEEVHLNRAVILSDDLARPERARTELEQALAIMPGYIPALLNLGNLREDLGEWEHARSAYEQVLSIDPDQPLALARYLGLARISSTDDPLLRRVEDAMHASPDPMSSADLGFALGKALDLLGSYDRAFQAYAAANVAARAVADAAGLCYDRQAEERKIERIITAFPAARQVTMTIGDKPPIFICGMFRSGSTLAERMLSRHSRITAGGELSTIPALIDTYLRPFPESIAHLTLDGFVALRDAYINETKARCEHSSILIDKRPDNYRNIGLIKLMFPAAKIIHTVRHPIDTCLSVFFMHADSAISYATDLNHIVHYQYLQSRLMTHWRALWPDDIIELPYDRLVRHPREVMQAVLSFCGLDWEDAVLDHRRDAGAIRTASHEQIREPLYQSSSGRSHNYAKYLDRIASFTYIDIVPRELRE